MSWKDRAKKIDPAKSPDLPEWKRKAKKVEEGRYAEAKKGESIREDISKMAKEFFTPPPAEDVAISAAQGATAGFADEAAGALVGAWKKVSGDDRPYEDIYREIRDSIRNKTYLARERSPLTSFIAENIGAAVNPLTRAGGMMKTAAQSGAIGLGEGEGEDIGEMAVDLGASALVGTAMHGATDIIKQPFDRPSSIRARFAGIKPKEFEKRGRLGDPRVMAEELNRARFFKYKNADFDIKSGKFKPVGTEGRGRPNREEALANAENATKKIRNEVNRLLKKSPKQRYFGGDLADYHPLVQELDDIIAKSTDEKKAMKLIDEELKKLQHSVDNPYEFIDPDGAVSTNPQGVSLSRLNEIKSNYQREARRNFEAVDPTFKEKSEIQEAIARNLKSFIEENAGQQKAKVQRLNRMAHQLHNAKKGLSPVTAQAEARGADILPVNPYAGVMTQALRGAAKIIGGGERGMLFRADVGEAAQKGYEKIPRMIRRPIEAATRQEPARLISREPQSIPEALVRTPLPRNTDEILEKKDFVLAKTAQQAPEMFDHVKEVIENHPEKLPKILPALVKSAPHLFENDEYERVDGKIIDPAMKEKARNDIMLDDSMSILDKTLIINELNKTGILHDS